MSSKKVNSCGSRSGFLDYLLCKARFEEKDSDLDCILPIEVNSRASRSGFLDYLLCKACFVEKDSDLDCINHVEEAINLTEAAVEEDKKGNFKEALRLLTEAQFKLHNQPQNARGKRVMYARGIPYREKLNKIKDYLINRKKYKQDSDGDATSSDNVTDNNEEDATLKKLKDAIVIKSPNIRWSDVAGLDAAKEALQEAIILPIMFPNLCTGQRKPSNGILLYGPPGSGKTFLAKTVATEANNYTFFSVSPTHLFSKFISESEKLTNHLFEVARQKKPSVIFIDYIDLIMFNSKSEKETVAATGMKTEFLLQMQGIDSNMDGIIVLGATNKPWALDEDVLRSFTKRIYVPLPDEADRLHILKMNVEDTSHSLIEEDFQQLAKLTDGFSGADIYDLIQDALMQPIRKMKEATHGLMFSGPSHSHPSTMAYDLLTPSSPGTHDAKETSNMDVPDEILSKPDSTDSDPHISMYDLLTKWKEEVTFDVEQLSTVDVSGTSFLEPIIPKVSIPSGAYSNTVEDLLTPCSADIPGAEKISSHDGENLAEPAMSMNDMLCSLENIKPSVNGTYLEKLKIFMEDIGQ